MMKRNSDSPSAAGAIKYGGTCDVVHVNDRNYHALNLRKSENRIMSSCLSVLEDEIKPHGLGLKFVSEGQETYWFKNKRHSLTKGKYLLVNDSVSALDIMIKDSGTRGVCVDIDAALVNDMLWQLIYPNDLENFNKTSSYLLTPELFVNEAQADKPLQELLQYIISSSASQSLHTPGIELIYELTHHVVRSNEETIRSYYRLDTAKLSTRKELFKRLLAGKEVLDDGIYTELSIKEVAEASCLSEFRFYRLFKQCFGDTPYNYLFKKRIDKSIELKKEGHNWVEIATLLNFTDLAAFSKSFKKVKGVSPSKMVL